MNTNNTSRTFEVDGLEANEDTLKQLLERFNSPSSLHQSLISFINAIRKDVDKDVASLKEQNRKLIKEKRRNNLKVQPRNFNNCTDEEACMLAFSDFVTHLEMIGISVVVNQYRSHDSKFKGAFNPDEYEWHQVKYFTRKDGVIYLPTLDGEEAGRVIARTLDMFTSIIKEKVKNESVVVHLLKDIDFVYEQDSMIHMCLKFKISKPKLYDATGQLVLN